MKRHQFALLILAFSPIWVQAAEFKLYPTQIDLLGPHASQRLLLAVENGGQCIGDLTSQARFTSTNPQVASVDEAGNVVAHSDGTTTITSTVDGQRSTSQVKVTHFQDPFAYSFRNHVIPLMTKIGCNSGACHGALAGKGGFKLSLRGYAPAVDHFVMTQQAGGRRIDRQEPGHSLFLLKPSLALNHGGGQKLDVGTPDYQLLADWIASGAPGPRDQDVRIQRLEVLPPAALLKPKDTLQILVRAWYADGHAEDVTNWVKFSSTEELVASVDQTGEVTVTGHGESAITMWYSNLVGTCRITSPQSNLVDGKLFQMADRKSYVDELVLQKLQGLRIPPSPACTDAEFLRRFYLDAAGILPTPEELQKFLADRSPDKRSRWIDALLERPEFVDYWSYKWSDVLLVSTHRLPQQAVWAFQRYIRQSVADNKPWDQFAREILTASGSNLEHGAANYFVLHKDVTDLTESTSVTFLGMSITCCRCHNHPLEKWTQDQYWSMANLFSRIALKNGDRAGEISVQAQPFGDVLHPRRGTVMPPTPLDGKAVAIDSPLDRRQYFADWLTSPENPYFARALVNRVWRNFMGRGLVEAEDDLRQTNPPTNPALLDALARDFMEHRYDVKHIIRTILNSASYQRSSLTLPDNVSDDRFYSHYLVKRLPAEVILDAYTQVTGVPTAFTQIQAGAGDLKPYGGYPLGTRALQLPDTQVVSRFLESFGRPARDQSCSCERQQDSSVNQALHLNNGQTLNDKLKAKNSRVEQWLQENVSNEVALQRIFALALARQPSSAEAKKLLDLMAESARDPQMTRRDILQDAFWAVLTGREFLFNH